MKTSSGVAQSRHFCGRVFNRWAMAFNSHWVRIGLCLGVGTGAGHSCFRWPRVDQGLYGYRKEDLDRKPLGQLLVLGHLFSSIIRHGFSPQFGVSPGAFNL